MWIFVDCSKNSCSHRIFAKTSIELMNSLTSKIKLDISTHAVVLFVSRTIKILLSKYFKNHQDFKIFIFSSCSKVTLTSYYIACVHASFKLIFMFLRVG